MYKYIYSDVLRPIPELLTQYIKAGLSAADRYSGWYVDGDAAKRAQVESPVDGQYPKVTRVLISASRVDQCPAVEGPVERDISTTRDVTTEPEVFPLDDVLADRSRVEVEAILRPRFLDHHWRIYRY